MVDTCVLVDVFEDDPSFGPRSAAALKRLLRQGLVICPISLVELSPMFSGDLAAQLDFLSLCGIDDSQNFERTDWLEAHNAWNRLILAKRKRLAANRPIADILIGAFALRFQGLLTRNPDDFQRWFPQLKIRQP
ncbi:MAG: type II toxin-antitoxin system VapC family toxin [Opitutales bacterium]